MAVYGLIICQSDMQAGTLQGLDLVCLDAFHIDATFCNRICQRGMWSSSFVLLAGALSGKGKIPYAILALLDVLRHYPGQVCQRMLHNLVALACCISSAA